MSAYSETWLKRGFPWVYRDEITRSSRVFSPGEPVLIRAASGAAMGVGLADEGKVALRRFREDPGPVDAALVRDRLRAALARRRLPAGTTAWRWVHAENDDMPGVRLDVWGDALTITLDAPGLVALLEPLSAEARALFHEAAGVPCRAVYLCWRLAAGEEGRLAGLPAGRVWGEAGQEDVEVQELGVRLRVRPADGFDAGLYCDMRELRAWMAPWWRGRRVLNTFAFTGAFSVSAAVHGAAEVLSVDLSPAALAWIPICTRAGTWTSPARSTGSAARRSALTW